MHSVDKHIVECRPLLGALPLSLTLGVLALADRGQVFREELLDAEVDGRQALPLRRLCEPSLKELSIISQLIVILLNL